MTGTIIFNGTSSEDFGLIVEKLPPSVHASRRGDLISIPGRNGVIVREDGSFDTYQQEYQISFTQAAQNRDPYQTARDIAVWLLGASGFCRLEDGFEPEHFRLARYSGEYNVDTVLMEYGKATLTFDCQPQRFLKLGESPIVLETSATETISNPTKFESRPLLKFTDTSTEPPFVNASVTLVADKSIGREGKVVNAPMYFDMNVTDRVDVQGKDMVRLICNGYTFLDENGNSRENYYVPTGGFPVGSPTGATVDNYWSVPNWAKWVVASKGVEKPVDVWTKDKHEHPGSSILTINSTTISLDFADHDIIYLDCDLHDAYYEGGENANGMVRFSSTTELFPTFPGLLPGMNYFVANSETSFKVEIVPRWWTL